MKKRALAGMVLLLLGGWLLLRDAAAPRGDTVESREAILRNERQIQWEIRTERELEEHLLCGITAGQRAGIAVFAPADDGYELLSRRWVDRPEAIVIDHALIGGKWYDLIWFSGAQTEYAELAYSQPGKATEIRRADTADGQVVYSEMPAGDYSLEVRYFDAQGNEYE